MPGEANIDSTFVIRRISSEHSLQLNCPEASCEDTTIKSKDETYFFLSAWWGGIVLLQFRNDTQMNWGDCIEGSLLDRVRELVLGFPAIKHTVWYDKWSQPSPRNSSVCKICTFCVEESLLFLLLSSRLMILQVTIVARMGFQKSPLNFPADAYRCNCALLSCLPTLCRCHLPMIEMQITHSELYNISTLFETLYCRTMQRIFAWYWVLVWVQNTPN